MRLISLTANKDSFKPVYFKNQTGLNIIVANQQFPDSNERGNTTNGVGKSLLVAIIHFCLGSNSRKSFKEQLPDWEFTLKFKIKDEYFTAIRSTSNPTKILLNGEELKLKEFNSKIGNLVFDIPQDSKDLTFRSLFPFFIRPKKSSYNSEDNPNAIGQPFQVQVVNAFLLGLDVSLAKEKSDLKNEKDRIKELVNNLGKDPYLSDFFIGKKDVSLTKNELDEKINNLEKDLSEFQIADDYYQIQEEADKLSKELNNIQNEIQLKKTQIDNIDKSLENSPDINKDYIERIYNEISATFYDQALKNLSDLESFYNSLSQNRKKRLLDQKNQIEKEIKSLNENAENKKQDFDEKLQYLNAHRALDVFVNLSNQLSDLKSKRNNLTKYEDLLNKYKEEQRKIDFQQLQAAEKTENYLKEASGIIGGINNFFRELVKRFYPNSPAGISINNNDKDNQIRYNIEADKSDGIGNVKIFCYDLTLLLKGFGHKVDFLFHDSRILDGIDPRQKHELFLILDEYINSFNKQYILTVNYNQLEELKKYFISEEKYNQVINNNVILELKDSSPEDKLLGIQVDMDYD